MQIIYGNVKFETLQEVLKQIHKLNKERKLTICIVKRTLEIFNVWISKIFRTELIT